ncbi:MAG: ATP-dependent DNA helicase RecG [Prevotellaceae bacterium]|nr:ATP-dependent DNA helicase RecG [Prevotellaceae bacterium]
MSPLEQSVKFLKGVGPRRAAALEAELGVQTVGDLLMCLPFRFVDRRRVHKICELQADMPFVQLCGRLVEVYTEGEGRKRRLKANFTDGTGYLELVWFHGMAHFEKTLRVDTDYVVLGRPQEWNGRFSLAHPEMEDALSAARRPRTLQPFYRSTDKLGRAGITNRVFSSMVETALALAAGKMEETLPVYILTCEKLLPLEEALRTAHFPPSAEALPEAMRRIKFEELFYLQLDILRYGHRRKRQTGGYRFARVGDFFNCFYREKLPFSLTGAQKRVLREIREDMRHGRQMNRLVQGDVGSGKTIVALMACLLAADNGFQAALMAPTEILAEQHYASLCEMTRGLGLNVALLTGSVKGKARRAVLQGAADGSVHLLVGTHALVEPTVCFLNLGLAVVDEQHRFGVRQRAALWEKNVLPPHVLVMTATPIPRTLAMTVYGDLDVSVIDELPPGRKPIRTLHYSKRDMARLYAGMRAELAAGRQAYVVFPLIEESEKIDLRNLEDGYAALCDVFPEFRVGRVHGRMKPQEKDEAMQAFLSRETQILVSTTVIEVGVNVPNASVMVVEEADRFGLSQLHQLRGRVGRGADQSYCLLVTKDELGETARRRMAIMTETNDGFEIAEEDMRLRGPGDIEGTQQSGLPFALRAADLLRDGALMQQARTLAAEVLEADPDESLPENAVLWRTLGRMKRQTKNFSAIS